MSTFTRTHIADLRRSINVLDRCIAQMLASRGELSREVQAIKKTAGQPVRDCAREAEIARQYEHTAPGLSTVSQAILEWCRHED